MSAVTGRRADGRPYGSDRPHGTFYRWSSGCRCEACAEEYRIWRRAWRYRHAPYNNCRDLLSENGQGSLNGALPIAIVARSRVTEWPTDDPWLMP